MTAWRLRPREVGDLPAIQSIIEQTREEDGYPPHWPENLTTLFGGPNELWMSVVGADEPVGHVALRRRSSRDVMDVASETTGLAAAELGVVARLFLRPDVRHQGLGRQLLDAAVAEAHRSRLQPILDVWTELHAAVALYETAGWRRAGTVTLRFGSSCTARCVHGGDSITSHVLIGPPLP